MRVASLALRSHFTMKTVCVFLVCCLAVALANRTSEEEELITKHLNECRKELNIPDPATLPRDATIPKSEQSSFGCIMFCMQKKRGLFNEDGTPNRAAIIANFLREAPERKETVEKLLDTCEKTVKPVNGCKMAACLLPSMSGLERD